MQITSEILNRLPSWAAAGWAVGETVDLGAWSSRAADIVNAILTDDAYAASLDSQPPHHP